MPRGAPVYFTDENTLGLGRLLRREGRDVLYPGHELLPEVPLGTRDIDWLPLVGDRQFIVITRDRRIRTRPAELALYHQHGVRSVWLGAKKDLNSHERLALFLRHEDRLLREITKLGNGPWALSLTMRGVRPLHLRPHPGVGR